jgi:hypothetical protein
MAHLSAEALFERYLFPLYPDDAARDLALARRTDANPAGNPALMAHLDDAARVFERMAGGVFTGDDLRLDRTDASVHRLSRSLTTARRDEWARRGEAGTADSELFNVVIHAAAYLGACIVAQHGGRWLVRRPLWESMVALESRAGSAELVVLQWVVKSLADPPPGAPMTTLGDRYRTHVETPCFDPLSVKPFVPDPARRIPRLAKVRYASLHQHLRAHIPELRDVGVDFPSPERFDAMHLAWLDFYLVGDGRRLVLFGPGEGGAYLFWLGEAGFDKSAHFPGESFPAPMIEVDSDKLRVLVQVSGKTAVHEMLWWGL